MRELLHRHLVEVVVAKMVPALAGVAFVGLASRWFEPAAYGVFSIAFSTANLAAVLTSVWLSQSVLRFAAGGGIPVGPVLTAALLPCLVLALLATAVPWPGSAGALAPTAAVVAGFVALALALAANTLVGAFATARAHFLAYRRAELARGVLLVLLTSALAAGAATGGAALVGAYAAATLLPSAALYLAIRSDDGFGPARCARWAWFGAFARFGWPMTIWAGLQASQALMERSLMSTLLPADRFGGFMAAVDVLARGFGLALMPVVTLAHSRLMAHAGEARRLDAKGLAILRSAVVLVVVFAVALGFGVWLAEPLLARIAPALAQLPGRTTAAMCISGALWILALLAHKPLEVACATRVMSLLLAAALLLEFVLLSHWAPVWSELAMPLASSVAAVGYIFGCTAYAVTSHRRREAA